MKLRIEKAIYGGAGLAHIAGDSDLAGKTIFVPYALPGELVEARIAGNRRNFATGELDTVIEPSCERVPPGCEYFPACGGCQCQHAGARYQVEMKLAILRDTVERAHLASHLPTIGSLDAQPWGYRNRIRLQIAQKREGKDKFALCYRERASHNNLPVTHCPIAAPLLERAVAAVTRIGAEIRLGELCHEIEFFTNGEQDALLVSLWTMQRNLTPRFPADFSGRLSSDVPELAGIGLFSSNDHGGSSLSHWGSRSLTYSVAGHEYQVSLGSFFQVNRFLLPGLIDSALSGADGTRRSGRVAWDLYAGVGLFSLALDFEHVTAVESSPSSAADLRQNLAATPHRVVQTDTLEFLRAEQRRKLGITPDLILVDPPRAGLDKDVCAELARLGAPEIVYVSCDPATLVRDLQALLHSGYCIRTMHMVDLFPQTFHLETVTALARI